MRMQLVYGDGCNLIGVTQTKKIVVLYPWVNTYMLHKHLTFIKLHPTKTYDPVPEVDVDTPENDV